MLQYNRNEMDKERIKELNFMLRTGVPIPVTDSRAAQLFQTMYYNDFYTIQELVEQKHMEYVGYKKDYICIRPYGNFQVYVAGSVMRLQSGELVTMSLSTDGRQEFEKWLAAQ